MQVAKVIAIAFGVYKDKDWFKPPFVYWRRKDLVLVSAVRKLAIAMVFGLMSGMTSL